MLSRGRDFDATMHGSIGSRTLYNCSEEGLKSTAREALGVDGDEGFAHKLEVAKLVKAWKRGTTQTNNKMKVDAQTGKLSSQASRRGLA